MDAAAWDAKYAAAGAGLLWSATPNRFLVQETEGLAPGRALDLACGEGRNALWLAAQGWQATGIDFSATALARGRAAAAERGLAVELLEADVVAYEPPLAAFDLVAVFYLHLPATERTRVLAAAVRGLAPGGVLLVVGHHLLNLTEGVGGPQDPALLFTPADVVREAGDGLVVEKAQRVARPVETGQGTREAIDALVRARRPEA